MATSAPASSLEDAYARLQAGVGALGTDVEALEDARGGGGGEEAKAEATVRPARRGACVRVGRRCGARCRCA